MGRKLWQDQHLRGPDVSARIWRSTGYVGRAADRAADGSALGHGQLADLERKTVEPMVLALKGDALKGDDRAAVRAGQQFLSEGAWNDARILARREAPWPRTSARRQGC